MVPWSCPSSSPPSSEAEHDDETAAASHTGSSSSSSSSATSRPSSRPASRSCWKEPSHSRCYQDFPLKFFKNEPVTRFDVMLEFGGVGWKGSFHLVVCL